MIKICLLGLTALLLAACQSNPVNTDYDTSVDFSRFQHYQLIIDDDNNNDLMHKRLVNAVNTQVLNTGLRALDNSTAPYLIIKPTIRSQQRTQPPSTRGSFGVGGSGGSSLYGISLSAPLSNETIVNDVVIVIAMLDSSNQKMIWQGSYGLTIETDQPELANKMINQAVADIFKQYPPR